MAWRKEEEDTVAVLYRYTHKDIDAHLTFEYENGEAYVCKYETAYDSDNQWEIDEGIDTREEDFFALAYHVLDVLQTGSHGFVAGEYIDIDYRDFPKRVVAEDGTVIYPDR
jgi:hypothetical protein